MPKIADENGLETWLKDKSPEFACVLAARAALRVAPLLVEALHEDTTARRAAIVLPGFRVLAAANFASAWPTRTAEIRDDARAAAREASGAISETSNDAQLNIVEHQEISECLPFGYIDNIEADARALGVAERAVDASTHAVQAAIDTVDAANGIAGPDAGCEAAIRAAAAAHIAVDAAHGYPGLLDAMEGDFDDAADVATHVAEFWNTVERDAELLETSPAPAPHDGADHSRVKQVLFQTSKGERNESAELVADLSKRTLWLDDMPIWAGRKWADLKDKLPEDEGWRVWIDWYEARLAGRSTNEAQEFARVTIPKEDWEQGPAHVNAIIAKRIEAQPDPLVAALTQSLEEVDTVSPLINLSQYANRIRDALPADPYQAVGATKEMLEATMKTILHKRGHEESGKISFPKLTKLCYSKLGLESHARPATEGEQYLRKIASNAKKMIEAVNELRNRAGTGHGRVVGREPVLTAADASLVACAGMVLATWLARKAGDA